MESKNFLFYSKWGEILDIAFTIKKEGHNVKMFVESEYFKEVGDGFIEKIDDFDQNIEWADIIIFDYSGYGKKVSELKSKGKVVIGGNIYTDKLEYDRSFGQDELKKHKIKILPYKEFDSLDKAIEYVEQNPNSYVIKPSGEIQDYKQFLFVGKDDDGEDVKRMLKAYKKTWGNNFGTIQLQKKVNGVEIGVSAFFNGNEFIYPININFEHKKLFPKEIGISTGEMGTSMFWVDRNPIFEETLKKMEKDLKRENYIGSIDLNCIVNGNGIYPLEFTPRFGYPQIYIQESGILDDIGEFFFKLATGEKFELNVRTGFQIGAYMVVPPFPYEDKNTFDLFSKDAVVIMKKEMKEGIHPMHLKMVNKEWLITGETGVAVLVTGYGTTMKDAQKMMYNRIGNILINNSYYRTDIGDRWAEDFDKLWAWGLL